MGEPPNFERDDSHIFRTGENVLVIDPNGYDLWEATIRSVDDGRYSLHYPEFPSDDEVVEGTSRILVRNRTNARIFKQQEATRNAPPPDEEEDEEPSESESDSSDNQASEESYDDGEEADYGRKATPRKKKGKNNKIKGRGKKNKKDVVKPRPEGARSSPRRSK